jgi:hypothetical protein
LCRLGGLPVYAKRWRFRKVGNIKNSVEKMTELRKGGEGLTY